MLNATSRELKSLKYRVSKIMCGEDMHIRAERNDKI